MRATANRKVNRQPVRSPSPDIANRSIITHTTAPDIRQVLSKSRSNLVQTGRLELPSNFDDISKALAQALQKIRELQRQLTGLLIQNSGLKKEVFQLRDSLTKSKQGIRPFDNQLLDVNLKEYEARIGRFSQQIKRIHQLLLKQKQKNQQLQSQNRNLKNYDPRYSSQSSKSSHRHEIPVNSLHFIQQTLDANFEKIKVEHDLKIHLSLSAMSDRLAKIEKNQAIIQGKVNRPQYRTPKSYKQPQKYEFSTGGYHSGSRDPNKFQQQNRYPQEREIDLLRDKIRVNQLQIQMIKKQNSNLTYQLQKQKDRSFTSECPNCKICLNKISELERQIENLKLLRGQSKLYQQRINELEQQNSDMRQLRQQNQFYLRKIQELQRQNQKLKQRQQQDYEKEVRWRYQKERKENNLTLSLEEYLRRVKDVKSILSNAQFRQFLQKVNLLINQNINLQLKLDNFQDQKSKSNRQGKGKQLQLRKQVGELTRQNQVIKAQNQELQDQVKKLKGIINQYIRQQQNSLYGSQKQRIEHIELDTQKYQNFIVQAIKRLQSMEQSIVNKIKQERQI